MQQQRFTFAALGFIVFFSLQGCGGPKGACVTEDRDSSPTSYYCFEDKTESDCDFQIGDETDTFYPKMTCAQAGYPYFCTYEDMLASGSSGAYWVERYLSNAACNSEISG